MPTALIFVVLVVGCGGAAAAALYTLHSNLESMPAEFEARKAEGRHPGWRKLLVAACLDAVAVAAWIIWPHGSLAVRSFSGLMVFLAFGIVWRA